jgi:formylglycine-generating enzyme required for sulfatase activity
MKNRIFGDYNVIKQVGQGSLGTVYLAEHRFMRRHYALKVLPEELASDRNFIQRFEEGIAQLSLLEHPNIVKIHNVSYAEGVYFLVMDCIVDHLGETTNMAQYLANHEGMWKEEKLFDFLYQVANALDYAHGQRGGKNDLTHHRLKLNNLLIGGDPNQEKIFLSDFGIAKIVGLGPLLSRTYKILSESIGMISGNQSYNKETYQEYNEDHTGSQRLHESFLQNYQFLAPEQKQIALLEDVGPKSDVYAFGVLAYYLMTRTYPEGIFSLPSELFSNYTYDWDTLIHDCLYYDIDKRPTLLTEIMNTIKLGRKTKPLAQIEKPLERLQEERRTPQLEENRQPVPAPPHYTPPTPSRKEPSQAIYPIVTEKTIRKTPSPQAVPPPSYQTVNQPVVSAVLEKPKVKPSLPPHQQVSQPTFKQEASTFPSPLPIQKEKPKPTLPHQPFNTQQVTPPFKSVEVASKPVIQKTQIKRPIYEKDPGAVFKEQLNVTQYQPKPVEVKEIEPILSEMVIVAGGDYQRGSQEGNRDEMPRHKVFLESFALDIHCVTNEQFILFLNVLGGEKDTNNNDIIRLRDSRIRRVGGKLTIESGYSKHPVVGVTWYGAVGYCKWVGKRLPTEAEWEIAAVGNLEEGPYPTGANIEKSQSNFFSADTTSVMSYLPNGYGIYDLVGNVYEWCQDWYGYNFYEESAQEPESPKGPIQGVYRVLRGGGWKSLKDDLRCSHRHRNNPGTVNSTYGFRCAANVE